jgi:hypothetical protein
MLPYLTGKEGECAEHITDVKKRAEFALEQPTKAQKESRGKLYFLFSLGARQGRMVNTTSRQLYARERHYQHTRTKHIKTKHALL